MVASDLKKASSLVSFLLLVQAALNKKYHKTYKIIVFLLKSLVISSKSLNKLNCANNLHGLKTSPPIVEKLHLITKLFYDIFSNKKDVPK